MYGHMELTDEDRLTMPDTLVGIGQELYRLLRGKPFPGKKQRTVLLAELLLELLEGRDRPVSGPGDNEKNPEGQLCRP